LLYELIFASANV